MVGVMPPGFGFPARSDLWTPAELWGETPSRTSHNWAMAVARRRDGVNLTVARSELSTLAHGLYQQYKPEIDMRDASVVPLRAELTTSVRPALLILLAAVGFLLLVACANVANLSLARAAERQRELAVRAALGAGRGRLVRQFLAESLLLSLTGSALGVLLALWGVEHPAGARPSRLAAARRNFDQSAGVGVRAGTLPPRGGRTGSADGAPSDGNRSAGGVG